MLQIEIFYRLKPAFRSYCPSSIIYCLFVTPTSIGNTLPIKTGAPKFILYSLFCIVLPAMSRRYIRKTENYFYTSVPFTFTIIFSLIASNSTLLPSFTLPSSINSASLSSIISAKALFNGLAPNIGSNPI